MTATPLQNQGAQTLGAGGATPDAAAPQIDADQEVIAKVLSGHKDAFAILITRYSDPLYRHALGMTGSPDVAEDILQASFIKAYQHLGEVRGRFDAWVFRIVANSCKDWLKNIRRTSDLENDLTLQAGDMVFVPRDKISKIERFMKLASVAAFMAPRL